jgi:hypothetical protein
VTILLVPYERVGARKRVLADITKVLFLPISATLHCCSVPLSIAASAESFVATALRTTEAMFGF